MTSTSQPAPEVPDVPDSFREALMLPAPGGAASRAVH